MAVLRTAFVLLILLFLAGERTARAQDPPWDCDGNPSAGSLNLEVGPGQSRTYRARGCRYTGDTRMHVRPGGPSGALDFYFEDCELGTNFFRIVSGDVHQLTLTIRGGHGYPSAGSATVTNSTIRVIRPPASAGSGSAVLKCIDLRVNNLDDDAKQMLKDSLAGREGVQLDL